MLFFFKQNNAIIIIYHIVNQVAQSVLRRSRQGLNRQHLNVRCRLPFQEIYVLAGERMFTWKYEDLKYGRLETRYADYGITRKKSGVERSRIFEKAVYVTPLQTHFRLPCWSPSDKPLRKQTFRQYRSRFFFRENRDPYYRYSDRRVTSRYLQYC